MKMKETKEKIIYNHHRENQTVQGKGWIAGWHKEDRPHVFDEFVKWIQYHSQQIQQINVQRFKVQNEINKSSFYTPSSLISPKLEMLKSMDEQVNEHRIARDEIQRDFETLLTRTHDDQTVKGPKPYGVGISKNLVVRVGVDRANHIIVGESRSYFKFAGIGIGKSNANPDNESLENEVIRIPITSTGGIGSLGDMIRITVVYPINLPSDYYSEHGVYDLKQGGVLWYRVRYPLNRLLEHTQGETFMTNAHYIYTRPI